MKPVTPSTLLGLPPAPGAPAAPGGGGDPLCAAKDVGDAVRAEHDEPSAAGLAGAPGRGRAARGRAVSQDVFAVVGHAIDRIGFHGVVSGAALDAVLLAVAGVDRVVAEAVHEVAVQLVAARDAIAGDLVVAGAADQRVVAEAAGERVVAGPAVDDVAVRVGGGQRVVAAGAGQAHGAALLGRDELVVGVVASEGPHGADVEALDGHG